MLKKDLKKLLLEYNLNLNYSQSVNGYHKYEIVDRLSGYAVATTYAEFNVHPERHINPNFEYKNTATGGVLERLKQVQTVMLLSTV